MINQQCHLKEKANDLTQSLKQLSRQNSGALDNKDVPGLVILIQSESKTVSEYLNISWSCLSSHR